MNHALLNGFGIVGSIGANTIRQPSSHVGKSSIALGLREAGFITCSFADEIRFALKGDPIYGDIIFRNESERPVEEPAFKKSLVSLGEGFNVVEPNGWALMAILKMILLDSAREGEPGYRTFVSKHTGFVVDDVRRPAELMLLKMVGIKIAEIIRTDGDVKEYGSDGRLAGIADHTYLNNGKPQALEAIIESLSCWKGIGYRRNAAHLQVKYGNGMLRMFAHLLSPKAYQDFSDRAFVSEYFSEALDSMDKEEALELRNRVAEWMLFVLRWHAEEYAIGSGIIRA